jgi:hypothetical protein
VSHYATQVVLKLLNSSDLSGFASQVADVVNATTVPGFLFKKKKPEWR